jgi:hypothetical protein
MRQLLPLGIQDFVDIREQGFVYVDKTARIHDLIAGSGKPFFLSRPRRFGKSLLCSTLEAIFEGRRELFGEIAGRPALAINSLEWGWNRHPVLKLSLNVANFTGKGADSLISVLDDALGNVARRNGLELRGPLVSLRFSNLIMDMHDLFKKRVAVIIDEYDKPLLDNMTSDETLRLAIQNELKGFYGVLKSADEHLRFLFLTGVTKFSKVSIFSDLNHLDDLTLSPRYADLCGITQEELEQNFGPEIDAILEETGRNRDEYMENLRQYYDGYRFSEKPLKVYNPYGLLHHFHNDGKFDPYWYESGTPTFLVNLVTSQKINIANLSNMQVRHEEFRKYDVENLKAEPVLYQSGYLTITDYNDDRNRYTLDFPNTEVRSSFMTTLLKQYLHVPEDRTRAIIYNLPDALEDGEIEKAIEAIRQYMAGVPYDIIKETENYYQTLVFLMFNQFGLNCRSEVRIASGRMDILVEAKNFVYCFEFKLDKTADEALAQIDTKEYLLPWTGSGKKLFKVGVNFDSEKRNIGDWKYTIVE